MDKKQAEQIERENLQALEDVLKTLHGRRFVWELLSYCGVYQDIVGEKDMVYRGLGKREVGLKILSDITDVNEDFILTMMKEAKERNRIQEANNERREQGPTDRDILAGADPGELYRESDGELHESGGYLPAEEYGGAIL